MTMILQVVVDFDFEDEEGLRQRWTAPIKSKCIDEDEPKSWLPKVDSEPLEPNPIDKGEAQVVDTKVRRQAPRAELCR